MLLSEIIGNDTVVCTEEMPLEEVFSLMDRRSADHVVVIESYSHRKPIGMVTEHDICMHIIGRGRDPRGLTAANVMNTQILRARASDSLAECREMFDRTGFRMLCVVNENGSLDGTVNLAEFESELEKVRTALPENHTFFREHVVMDRIF